MADKVVVIDTETQEIIDKYRRSLLEIPSKRQAVRELILKGWEIVKNKQ